MFYHSEYCKIAGYEADYTADFVGAVVANDDM